MSTTTRWVFEAGNSSKEYVFPRNPNRYGGDSYWEYDLRMSELDIIGSSQSNIQIDGIRSGKRTLRFTFISGTMYRKLQDFYKSGLQINNCKDHLWTSTGVGGTTTFKCVIVGFSGNIHPSLGDEDNYDLEMVLLRVN